MRRFCFNHCFKGWLFTRIKIWKIRVLTWIVSARLLNMGSTELNENETHDGRGYSRGFRWYPMYNPQGVPLNYYIYYILYMSNMNIFLCTYMCVSGDTPMFNPQGVPICKLLYLLYIIYVQYEYLSMYI